MLWAPAAAESPVGVFFKKTGPVWGLRRGWVGVDGSGSRGAVRSLVASRSKTARPTVEATMADVQTSMRQSLQEALNKLEAMLTSSVDSEAMSIFERAQVRPAAGWMAAV